MRVVGQGNPLTTHLATVGLGVTADGAVNGTSYVTVMTWTIPAPYSHQGELWQIVSGGSADFPSDAAPAPFNIRLKFGSTVIITWSMTPPVTTARTLQPWRLFCTLSHVGSGINEVFAANATMHDKIQAATVSTDLQDVISTPALFSSDLVMTLEMNAAKAVA